MPVHLDKVPPLEEAYLIYATPLALPQRSHLSHPKKKTNASKKIQISYNETETWLEVSDLWPETWRRLIWFFLSLSLYKDEMVRFFQLYPSLHIYCTYRQITFSWHQTRPSTPGSPTNRETKEGGTWKIRTQGASPSSAAGGAGVRPRPRMKLWGCGRGGGREPDRWSGATVGTNQPEPQVPRIKAKGCVCVVEPRASGWPNVVRVDQRWHPQQGSIPRSSESQRCGLHEHKCLARKWSTRDGKALVVIAFWSLLISWILYVLTSIGNLDILASSLLHLEIRLADLTTDIRVFLPL